MAAAGGIIVPYGGNRQLTVDNGKKTRKKRIPHLAAGRLLCYDKDTERAPRQTGLQNTKKEIRV